MEHKKQEIMVINGVSKYFHVQVSGNTIFMSSEDFEFMYTVADDVVKDEFKGQYLYLGGIQHNFENESPEAIELERKLSDVAFAIMTTLGRQKLTN